MAAYGLTHGSSGAGYGARAELRGVNVDRNGKVFPRVAWNHYEILERAATPPSDSVIEIILRRVCTPESALWKNYLAVRKGVREARPDGLGEYTVSKLPVPRYEPPWEKAAFGGKPSRDGGKVKKYGLAQVLSDCHIRDKYEIPKALIYSVGNLALSNPADAAATLQEFLQFKTVDKNVHIRVTAAAYANGVGAAARDIKMLARGVPQAQIGVPSKVIGERLYMYSDMADEPQWSVRGPLKYSETVADIYRLANVLGRHETIHLFEQETARLQIGVFIGLEEVSPVIINHVGASDDFRYLLDSGVEEDLPLELKDRCLMLKKNVMSLCDGEQHRASSLRLSESAALAPHHVYAELSKPVVERAKIGSKQAVGEDLWAFRHDGPYIPWSYRDPVIGEAASVLFHNGHEVVLSEAFKVTSCDGSLLLSDRVDGVVPGMSGGAVVALSDMALLGVHTGATLTKLRATRITETTYYDVCDFVTEETDRTQHEVGGWAEIADQLAARKLATSVDGVVKSMTNLSVGGFHAGTAIKMQDGYLSSVVPDGDYELGHVQQSVTFSRKTGLVSLAEEQFLPCLYQTRVPQFGEAVFLLASDAAGMLSSGELQVSHVGPYARNFVVSPNAGLGDEMLGGVVVSLHDACVLGQMVRSVDGGLFCVNIPPGKAETRADLRDEVSRVFPKFLVSQWDLSLLTDAFDVSGGLVESLASGLAELGKTTMKARAMRKFLSDGVPRVEWQAQLDRNLSDENLARCMDNTKLVPYMNVSDADGQVSEAAKALVFAALTAVVAEHERPEDVDDWLVALKADGVRPLNARRPSGFDVLASDGRVLRAYDE